MHPRNDDPTHLITGERAWPGLGTGVLYLHIVLDRFRFADGTMLSILFYLLL
jgi:hypothetical protein